MYSIQYVDPKELSKVKIKHQEKIIKRTGSKFIPLKAYEILKEETDDFSKEVETAQKVDALFSSLLEREGITLSPPPEKTKKPKAKKEKQTDLTERRMRFLEQLDLELLELELELELEMKNKKKKAA